MPISNKLCPQCGNKMFNNKGISTKTGKPFENYKCSDKDCGHIEWVSSKDLGKEVPQNTSSGFEKVNFGGEDVKKYIQEMGLVLEKKIEKAKEEIIQAIVNHE